MAVATGPYVMINPIVTIETVSYTNQLRTARLVPETTSVTYPTLDPTGTIQAYGNTAWTLELEGIQNELHEALLDAEPGDQLSVVLQAKPGVGQRKATFEIAAKPVPFGGTVNEILSFEDSFAVVGAITWGVSA
jgi:FKBP-type peptidyl-prolyl cis-trans isomerase 2